MADLYADDAAVDPIKVSYDPPTILTMAGEVRGRRVLDVGCASGGVWEGFVARGGGGGGRHRSQSAADRAGARAARVEGGAPCGRHRRPAVVPRGGVVRCRGRVARPALPC